MAERRVTDLTTKVQTGIGIQDNLRIGPARSLAEAFQELIAADCPISLSKLCNEAITRGIPIMAKQAKIPLRKLRELADRKEHARLLQMEMENRRRGFN